MSLQGALIFWVTFWFKGTIISGVRQEESGVDSSGSKEVAETCRPRAGLAGIEAMFLIRGDGNQTRSKQLLSGVSSFPLYHCRVRAYKWHCYHVYVFLYIQSHGVLVLANFEGFAIWEISWRLVVYLSPSGSSTYIHMDILLVSLVWIFASFIPSSPS